MTLDLSAITDSLLGLVKSQWGSAPIWAQNGTAAAPPPSFSGLAPDALREQSGPQLGLYLYHVESNNAAESLFWQPQMLDAGTSQPVAFLPFAIDAFYLLSAYSESSYIDEQQAMSVAMKLFHDQPIMRSVAGAATPWELTLTLEHRSYDELSRLWQATTAPLRMSLVYRAAIVFLDPAQMPDAAPDPKVVSVSVGPFDPQAAEDQDPELIGSSREVTYTAPGSDKVSYEQSPATVAPGQRMFLIGTGLGSGLTDTVFLLDAGGTETDVTAWAVSSASTPSRTAMQLPDTIGSAPAASPVPGLYQFRIGHGALGTPGSYRTNATPVGVAAAVDPAGGPLLSGTGPFTVHGEGFESGTEVFVGTVALASVTGAPSPGQAAIDPSGTSLAFDPPAGSPGTIAAVRVLVAGVESDPALWVTL